MLYHWKMLAGLFILIMARSSSAALIVTFGGPGGGPTYLEEGKAGFIDVYVRSTGPTSSSR